MKKWLAVAVLTIVALTGAVAIGSARIEQCAGTDG